MDGTIYLNFSSAKNTIRINVFLHPSTFIHLDFKSFRYVILRVSFSLILIISERDVTYNFSVSFKKIEERIYNNLIIQVHLIYFKANNYRPYKIHPYLFCHIYYFTNIALGSLSKENLASPYTRSCDPPKRSIPITRILSINIVDIHFLSTYPRIAGWQCVYPRKRTSPRTSVKKRRASKNLKKNRSYIRWNTEYLNIWWEKGVWIRIFGRRSSRAKSNGWHLCSYFRSSWCGRIVQRL